MNQFETDIDAVEFLKTRGFKEIKNGVMNYPYPDYVLDQDEADAVTYLFAEWDFDFA